METKFLQKLAKIREEHLGDKNFPHLPKAEEIVLPKKSLIGQPPDETLVDAYKFMLKHGRHGGVGKYLFPYGFNYTLGPFVCVFFVNLQKDIPLNERYAFAEFSREGNSPVDVQYFEVDEPEFVIPDYIGEGDESCTSSEDESCTSDDES